eukprot:TRINITY_DN752_c0_g1_i3.p1 TRINITY_DN752_c0_g1~~TRINITY_DN752_c0_g1_i3.p1  ORF type:complete len:244 (-),score=99.13 TRINITY_DN752_c0_g1_i3:38-769(-)
MSDQEKDQIQEDVSMDTDFGGKKKKKKKTGFVAEETIAEEPAQEPTPEDELAEEVEHATLEDEDEEEHEHTFDGNFSGDGDYPYQFLLERAFDMLHQKNPEAGGRKKYSFKPPQVMREGTKKSVFVNFPEICDLMKRSKDHVLQFLLVEMGTSGTLDAENRLTLKGRFPPKHIESILKKYITDYVVCNMCKSLDTTLVRDPHTRLHVLQCEACAASRSVSAVKSGFVATGKGARKAAKNAAGV